MKFATKPLRGRGDKARIATACLGCLLLLAAGGCATERWCNELNDYSTLPIDREQCQRSSGLLGQGAGSFDDCMKSLGWRPCPSKSDDAD